MSNLTAVEDWIANGTQFNGTASPAAGVGGTFGTPLIMGIVLFAIVFFAGWKAGIPIDLMIIGSVAILEILAGVFLEDWILSLFIIGGGGMFGLGLLKLVRSSR